MKNKKQILKTAQKLNNFENELNEKEVQDLYDLIKKSDDKETSDDYKELMLEARDAEDVYRKLHYINQALLSVGIKVFQL